MTGAPSVSTATGSAPSVAPRNCTAVTATGSRPVSRRPWATVTVADSSSETRTRPSPASVAPPPPPPTVTRPTPPSDTTKPSHATGGATVRYHTAAIAATSTGTAPISRDAWVTLVRAMPAFCTMTEPPYPSAPATSTAGVNAPWRPPRRRATASRTAAASPNRATVSQPGDSQARATLDSGTVVPHSSPAAARAATA
jgi:hypothetical protein